MTVRLALAVAVPTALCLAACGGDGGGENIPGGSYAGSTATDREFTIEIGDEIRVNNLEARFVDTGVLEIRELGDAVRITCTVSDPDGEELRCTVATKVPDKPPTEEVVDLMLL